MSGPITIASQGHFFTGIREVTTDFGVAAVLTDWIVKHAEDQ